MSLRCARVVLLSLALVAPIVAEAAVASSSRTAMILLRALVYDRKLPERVGPSLDVLVADAGTGTCGAEMKAAFQGLPATTVKGLPLVVTSVTVADPAALDAALTSSGADAVFLCDGIDVVAVAPVLVQRRVVGMTATRAGVAGGLALGAIVDDTGGAKVVVNLSASRESGFEFAADLFAIAEVIR